MRIPLLKWAMIILATTDIGGQLTLSTFADETAIDDVNKADAAKAAELAKMELAQWKFSCGAKPSRELTLVAMPILRWSNPTVGRVHGNLYVLTDDDCPQVIVCPYKFFAPWTGFDMECVSLSSSEVHGRRNEKVIWSSGHTAIDWKPVPDSPVVGKSSAERQRQLKQLAAEFVAELVDRRVNDNGEDQQLRLLTQPVYRYVSPTHNVLNGGVFAFVVGTDPELLLVLEAIESSGLTNWRYGLVRMNVDGLAVKFKNEQIWSVDRITQDIFRDSKQPYFLYNIAKE